MTADPLMSITTNGRVFAAIVNYDRADMTVDAVRSLRSHHPRLDIAVIDNGSPEPGPTLLREHLSGDIRLVTLGANGGYAAACNMAIRIAEAEGYPFAWLLNNDLEFDAPILDSLLNALAADDRNAAVTPVTVTVDDPPTVLSAGVRLRLPLAQARHLLYGAPLSAVPSGVVPVDALDGACMLVAMRAVRSVGGFDEGFFMYWEDTEWALRARAAGWRIVVDRRVHVRHGLARSSTRESQVLMIVRSRIRFARLIPDALIRACALAWIIGVWIPAYTVARLIPTIGAPRAVRLVGAALAWNLAESRRGSGSG